MSGSLQAAAREAEETCDGLQSSVLSQSPAHTGAMGEGKEKLSYGALAISSLTRVCDSPGYLTPKQGMPSIRELTTGLGGCALFRFFSIRLIQHCSPAISRRHSTLQLQLQSEHRSRQCRQDRENQILK